jgi:hypothetical protein
VVASTFVRQVRADDYGVICSGSCKGHVLEWKWKVSVRQKQV